MQALQNTDDDIEALSLLFERLAGFDDTISLEWFDGCLTALVACPGSLAPDEVLPDLLGEAWERALADPEDVVQAMSTLLRRWRVVASQLDPEALYDEPDRLRLAPLMDDFDPALRDRLLAEGQLSPEQAADWPGTGEVWALGFLETVERLAMHWAMPDDGSEAALDLQACLQSLRALTLRDAAALRADLAIRYPGRSLDRDDLIDEACFAVQDLRCLWLECSLRPEPRRVQPVPGRNDPCPCGSGMKYKKCHGAVRA
jgi:uncharacterized protein